MWFLFGRKEKARKVRGGRKERRTCPECGEEATFVEVTVEKTYTAYVAIDLFNTESTAFRCSECGALAKLEDAEPTAAQKAEAARAKARAEEERRREIAEDAKRARAESAAKEADLDDELAAMKARLGID